MIKIETSYTIKMLLDEINDQLIDSNFILQREVVWKPGMKTLLIDSILNGVAIHPITLMQTTDDEYDTKLLTDGKQRMSAIYEFRYGNMKLTRAAGTTTYRAKKMVPQMKDGKRVLYSVPGKSRRQPVMVPDKDENGNFIYEVKEIKLSGKTYETLPKELKERFNNYSLMPVRHMTSCTKEQIQRQMIRDNISIKMTPVQIGEVVSGEEGAKFKASFRNHDLFVEQSIWKNGEVNNDGIERCLTESFVLLYDRSHWGGYDKNVGTFAAMSTNDMFDDMREVIDRLSGALKGHKDVYTHLTAKNMFLIIPNFKEFMDMEYADECYGNFLSEWFSHIKSTTEYALFDATSTKSKGMVMARLDILAEELNKYMTQNGYLSQFEEDGEDNCVEDMLDTYIENFGGEEKDALCALMEIDNYNKHDDFSDANVAEYKNWLKTHFSNELAAKCLAIQDEIISAASEDSDLTNPYNLPIVIRMFNEQVDDEHDKKIFKAWIEDFDNACDSAYVEFAGKAFCDYNDDGVDPTLNSTIYNKKSVLDESYRRFAY